MGQRGFERRGYAERWYRVVMGANDTPVSPYDQAKRSVEALGRADQLRLIAELVARLRGEVDREPRRSSLALRGLGRLP